MTNTFNKDDLTEVKKTVRAFNRKVEAEMDYKSSYNGNVLSFDWLDEFEEACPRIDLIVRNAKVTLMQEENIELIEKAKRITVESVKDLAKHTNYINEIDSKTGGVKPGKILDIRNEETFNIYENRFLYTLIHEMEDFVLRKEDDLKKLEISDSKVLEYKGKAKSNKDRINIELKITADSLPSDEVKDDLKEKIKDLKRRIKDIKIYIGSWYKSEMMKSLERAHIPFVKPPLKKTNILLKNQNFKIATKLWEFIRNYDDDQNNAQDNLNSNGTNAILDFLNHSFLLDYAVMDSIFSSKREQKKQLSKYAVVLLSLEMKRIIELLRSQGIKIDDEELLRMLANEVNEEKDDRLAGSDDIKKKFKKAMDEYLERTQEYL
ncbi:MAG: DUF2357 domain-containing protein [Firmicutes bacterium]|nr:DUF2357 domain-containing protein [Bacillota bacterium]